jgi:hypothetical protein
VSTKRKYHRLAPSIWAEICAEWEVGDTTLEELATRFGVNTRTLQAHFLKNSVAKGSKAAQLASAVKEELFKLELEGKGNLIQRARETRESAYKNAVAVETLIMGQLELAQKDPSQAFKAASAVKLLSLAAAGLERLHALKWSALGMNRDSVVSDELPKLIFVDLTDEEINAIQQGEDADDADTDEARHHAEPSETKTDKNHDEIVASGDEDDDEVVEEGEDEIKKAEPLRDAAGSRYVREAQPSLVNPFNQDFS